MKRTLITFTIILTAVVLYAFAQEKKYTISVTQQEAQVLLDALDQSNAPHGTVKALQGLIIGQINEQIKADTAKVKKP